MPCVKDSGYILLDAIVAVFILSVGMASALFAIGTYLRSVNTMEEQVLTLVERQNARAAVWFSPEVHDEAP